MVVTSAREEYSRVASLEPAPPDVEAGAEHCDDRQESPPQAVVWAFFFLGVGILLPWNVLLSTIDFYSVLFPNISIAQFITNANTFPFMVAGIVLAVSSGLSKHRRSLIFFGFVSLTFLTALLPMLSARDAPFETAANALVSTALWFTVFTSAVIGAVTAIVESLLFGILGLFPGGTCTAAFSTGMGVASILISGLRILLRLVMDGGDSQGSLTALQPGFKFFLLTCSVLCGFCAAVFLGLDQYSAYYANYVPSAYVAEEPRTFAQVLRDAKDTLGLIAQPAVCALLSFVITLSLFPGIMVQIPVPLREGVSATMKSWYPLIVVAFFAVGDTIGRGFPTERLTKEYPNALPILLAARIAFVPTYLAQWMGTLPMNWFLIMLMVLSLGIANGLVATWAFLMIPERTPVDRREMAGRLMFVMLISGMSIGNVLGWGLEAALRCASEF